MLLKDRWGRPIICLITMAVSLLFPLYYHLDTWAFYMIQIWFSFLTTTVLYNHVRSHCSSIYHIGSLPSLLKNQRRYILITLWCRLFSIHEWICRCRHTWRLKKLFFDRQKVQMDSQPATQRSFLQLLIFRHCELIHELEVEIVCYSSQMQMRRFCTIEATVVAAMCTHIIWQFRLIILT